jgi:hypothetical protein
MPEDLTPDSVQLSWERGSFDPKDIPSGHPQYGAHSLYCDIVHFSKHEGETGWWFHTMPNYIRHKEHIGKLQFTILVSGDDVTPAIGLIDIDYRGDWKGVGPVDVGPILTLRRRFFRWPVTRLFP